MKNLSVICIACFSLSFLVSCGRTSPEYALTYSASDVGGYVVGNKKQVVKENESGESVIAVPTEGYRFSMWSDGVETAQRTDSSVHCDVDVTADFVPINYVSLKYSTEDINKGFIVGDALQCVEAGQSATEVSAVAESGFVFCCWSDGLTNATRKDENVAGDGINVVATFSPVTPEVTFSLKYSASIGGFIEGNKDQVIRKGEDSKEVIAHAEYGYKFTSWSDGLQTTARVDKTVSSDLTVEALFEAVASDKYFSVSYSASDGGFIEGAKKQSVKSGEDAENVIAHAESGFAFVNWSDGIKTNSRTDKSVSADIEVNALFEAIVPDKYFSVTYSASDGGFIEGNKRQLVKSGQDAENVIAHAEYGYKFTSWSDGNTSRSRSDEAILADASLTATFEAIAPDVYHSVTYEAGDGGFIEGNKYQSILEGSSTTKVIAHASSGYDFVSWSDGISTAERNDTNITKDESVSAVFKTHETSNIPFIFINTKDKEEVTSREKYVKATIGISNTEQSYLKTDQAASVKVRGNSTSGYAKKPYRIKFDKKQSIFGKTAQKNWVLLADYLDPSFLHNWTAFELTKHLNNTAYSPMNEHVRVYLNGVYAGLYLMTEQPDEKEGRVNIEQDISEGMTNWNFMGEFDASANGDTTETLDETYFLLDFAGNNMYFSLKYPEKSDFSSTTDWDAFLTYFKNCIISVGNAVKAKDYSQITSLVDEGSLIDAGIIDLLLGNRDHLWKSLKFFKIGNAPMKFGPVWDYDWCLNTAWTGTENDSVGDSEVFGYNAIYDAYFSTAEGKTKAGERWSKVGHASASSVIDEINTEYSSLYSEMVLDYDKYHNSNYDLIKRNKFYLEQFIYNESDYLTKWF